MLTDTEFSALVCVLKRAPLTEAEIPAINAIVNKLKPEPQPQAVPPATEPV